MQYDVKTPKEYLALLERDWRRETLLQLRKLIQSAGPKLKEGISYGMLSYGDAAGGILALNAQKHYVSLYVGDTKKIDPDGALLKGLNLGKGCIRLSKTTSIADTGIEAFIKKVIAMRKRGEDLGC